MKNLAQKGGATPPKLKIRTEDSTLANKADQDLKNNTDSDEEDNDEDASSSSTDSDDGEVFAVGGSDSGRENKENRYVTMLLILTTPFKVGCEFDFSKEFLFGMSLLHFLSLSLQRSGNSPKECREATEGNIKSWRTISPRWFSKGGGRRNF